MEKNLYWVKLSIDKTTQDHTKDIRIAEHFISAGPDDFESELNKIRSSYRPDEKVTVASIDRL